MKNILSVGSKISWLPWLSMAVVLCACVLRFSQLGEKLYWSDEVFTSLRISGYTTQEYRTQIFRDQPISVTDLWRFQTVQPDKSPLDTVRGLAVDEAQLPPLYFVLVRGWAVVFGSSHAAVRSLSAFMGMLLFPALYWLGRELFGKSPALWVSIALVAASPFHLLYAQEARPYALWTVLTVAASAALLSAMRLGKWTHWTLYALLAALNLWTYLFSLFVLIAHGLFVFAEGKFRFSVNFRNWLIATVGAIASFVPWVMTIVLHLKNVRGTTDWTANRVGVGNLLKMWGSNLSLLFFDWQPGKATTTINSSPNVTLLVIVASVLLVGWSFWMLVRLAPQRTWLLIVSLTTVTFLALALPDLLRGGQRSGIMRYTIPVCLGLQLAVSFALAECVGKGVPKAIGRMAIGTLAVVGLVCGVRIVQSEVWWNKLWTGGDYHTQQTATLVNHSPRPLVIGEDEIITASLTIAYVHLFDAHVTLLPLHNALLRLPEGYSDIYVLNPSKELQAQLSRRYRLKPAFEPGKLWALHAPQGRSS